MINEINLCTKSSSVQCSVVPSTKISHAWAAQRLYALSRRTPSRAQICPARYHVVIKSHNFFKWVRTKAKFYRKLNKRMNKYQSKQWLEGLWKIILPPWFYIYGYMLGTQRKTHAWAAQWTQSPAQNLLGPAIGGMLPQIRRPAGTKSRAQITP